MKQPERFDATGFLFSYWRKSFAQRIDLVKTDLGKPREVNDGSRLVRLGKERLRGRQLAVRADPLSELEMAPNLGVPQRTMTDIQKETA